MAARKSREAAIFERANQPLKVFVRVDDLQAILREITPPLGDRADEAIERIGDAIVLALKADAIVYRQGGD